MSHKNQPSYFPNNKKQFVSTQTSRNQVVEIRDGLKYILHKKDTEPI